MNETYHMRRKDTNVYETGKDVAYKNEKIKYRSIKSNTKIINFDDVTGGKRKEQIPNLLRVPKFSTKM